MNNQRKARIFTFFVIFSMLLGVVGMPTTSVKAATTITFTAEEFLSRPTDTSINVNVVPASAIDLYYDYGTISGGTYSSTSTVSAAAGTPCNVVISGLSPDTK